MTTKTHEPGQNSNRHGTRPHRCSLYPPRPGDRQHSPCRSLVLAATLTDSPLRQLAALRHLPVARSPPARSNSYKD